MNLKLVYSLPVGLQSDLVINRYDTELSQREDFIVLHSLKAPKFYFGNLLYINDLTRHSVEQWKNIFSQEFAHRDDVRHITLYWKQTDHNSETLNQRVAEFTRAGFHFDEFDIRAVTMAQWITPILNDNFDCRPITSEPDWQQWFDLNLEFREADHEEEDYRIFLRQQLRSYKKLILDRAGFHQGMFQSNGQLIAFAGLYFQKNIGRFQFVFTHPEFRRQGLCNTLLHHMADMGFQRTSQLVIAADEHDQATHMYARLGFQVVGREASLCKW